MPSKVKKITISSLLRMLSTIRKGLLLTRNPGSPNLKSIGLELKKFKGRRRRRVGKNLLRCQKRRRKFWRWAKKSWKVMINLIGLWDLDKEAVTIKMSQIHKTKPKNDHDLNYTYQHSSLLQLFVRKYEKSTRFKANSQQTLPHSSQWILFILHFDKSPVDTFVSKQLANNNLLRFAN